MQINVTELRQHLPDYLKKVQAGEEIQITSRGQIIARLMPEVNAAEAARKWLESLRDKAIVGDVESPSGEEWNAEKGIL